jgi:hypothetical protein
MSFLDPITGGGGPADSLTTTTQPVDVSSSAAPGTGQVLTADDATHASWQNLPTPPATLDAGNGLVRTGDRIDVVPDADGSIDVTESSIRIGTLANDAQHGALGGGALHALATTSAPGFMSALDKSQLNAFAGAVSPYARPRVTPNTAFDDEFDSGSPDLATRGWRIGGYVGGTPNGTLFTRVGDVRFFEPNNGTLAANTYRSTIINSVLFVQLPVIGGAVYDISITRAIPAPPTNNPGQGAVIWARMAQPCSLQTALAQVQFGGVGVFYNVSGAPSSADRMYTVQYSSGSSGGGKFLYEADRTVGGAPTAATFNTLQGDSHDCDIAIVQAEYFTATSTQQKFAWVNGANSRVLGYGSASGNLVVSSFARAGLLIYTGPGGPLSGTGVPNIYAIDYIRLYTGDITTFFPPLA